MVAKSLGSLSIFQFSVAIKEKILWIGKRSKFSVMKICSCIAVVGCCMKEKIKVDDYIGWDGYKKNISCYNLFKKERQRNAWKGKERRMMAKMIYLGWVKENISCFKKERRRNAWRARGK
jgi:hypothetical protein